MKKASIPNDVQITTTQYIQGGHPEWFSKSMAWCEFFAKMNKGISDTQNHIRIQVKCLDCRKEDVRTPHKAKEFIINHRQMGHRTLSFRFREVKLKPDTKFEQPKITKENSERLGILSFFRLKKKIAAIAVSQHDSI